MENELINYLSEFITPERKSLFEKVIENRTRYLTVVLEDIYQPQNASAVLRTADCFGIQDVHVIENRNEFQVDTEVSLGSSKWISLKKYKNAENNSLEAIHALKKQGYRIIATSPHTNDINLEDFDLTKGKAALIFGTELTGITNTIKREADEFMKIPMHGFTESFNISVSAAIVMHHLTHRLKTNSGIDWQLTQTEKESILLQWIKNTIKKADLLEKKFYAMKGK